MGVEWMIFEWTYEKYLMIIRFAGGLAQYMGWTSYFSRVRDVTQGNAVCGGHSGLARPRKVSASQDS